jgi:RND superfamily putative drug exporter
MLAMTTLLPALLVLFGRGVFWPRIPKPGTPSNTAAMHGLWSRLADIVGRHPRRIWITTALALAALALGTASLSVGSYQGGDAYTREPEFVAGQRLLSAHFPSGTSSPVILYAPAGTTAQVTDAAKATAGVAAVGPAQPSANGSWARIPAVLADEPDSKEAKETVQRLRARIAGVDSQAVAGGRTAAALDQQQAMNRDLKLLIPLILLVIGAILGLLLRAVIAALMLLACVTLSAAAGLGTANLIFHALGYPRVDPTVLLFGFLFLTAIGVDYTIFLMSRAREEAARHGNRQGVLNALTVTGGVITSAGVVLVATFAVLTVTPVVINLQLGILVAVGILLDTFIVRTLLVPALALHLGPKTWWPGMSPKS